LSGALDAAALALPGVEVRVLDTCPSTNSYLLEHASALRLPCLVAAKEQTAGRGRRGRRWHSARGAGVAFSIGRVMRRPARELAGISLVAGVAVAKALRDLGASQARLKWPNDVVAGGAKLGGILVETRRQSADWLAVVGIGINCRHDERLERRLTRAVTALDRLIAVPDESRLIGAIAARLLRGLDEFEERGLEPARRDWQSGAAASEPFACVRLPDGRVCSGVASGLAEDGGLRLRTRRGMRVVHSGTVLAPIMGH